MFYLYMSYIYFFCWYMLLQEKIDHIGRVVDEFNGLKLTGKITGLTKIVWDWITLCLTSDLSEAIANHNAKYTAKSLKETTVDDLLFILEADLVEKRLALEEENKK